jgi:hypothetical protein
VANATLAKQLIPALQQALIEHGMELEEVRK